MSQPNRTSRRVVIGRLEQLDERIALSGTTATAVSHSGPVVSPVAAYPPFVYNYSTIYDSTGHYKTQVSGSTTTTSKVGGTIAMQKHDIKMNSQVTKSAAPGNSGMTSGVHQLYKSPASVPLELLYGFKSGGTSANSSQQVNPSLISGNLSSQAPAASVSTGQQPTINHPVTSLQIMFKI
jgi:hypothetical protein